MSPPQALLESELQRELAGDVIHAADVSLGECQDEDLGPGEWSREIPEFQCHIFSEWLPKLDISLYQHLRQYADYALWQRKWLEQGESQRCLKYWRRKLEGVPP